MTKHSKMSQPVLTEKVFRTELKEVLSNYPTKADLQRELSKLKRVLKAEFAASEERLEKRLSLEFTRQVNAILAESRRLMGIVDEKYNDLPDRVVDLEKAVGIAR